MFPEEIIGLAERTAAEKSLCMQIMGLDGAPPKIICFGLFNIAFFAWAGLPHGIKTMGWCPVHFNTRMAASVNWLYLANIMVGICLMGPHSQNCV